MSQKRFDIVQANWQRFGELAKKIFFRKLIRIDRSIICRSHLQSPPITAATSLWLASTPIQIRSCTGRCSGWQFMSILRFLLARKSGSIGTRLRLGNYSNFYTLKYFSLYCHSNYDLAYKPHFAVIFIGIHFMTYKELFVYHSCKIILSFQEVTVIASLRCKVIVENSYPPVVVYGKDNSGSTVVRAVSRPNNAYGECGLNIWANKLFFFREIEYVINKYALTRTPQANALSDSQFICLSRPRVSS